MFILFLIKQSQILFAAIPAPPIFFEKPNKIKVIQYTSYGSKFDPTNTPFAFTEESLNDLINFLNTLTDTTLTKATRFSK